jgi:5'-nucleotidase
MIRVFVDMDDTLCDFVGRQSVMRVNNPSIAYPQSQYGFFTDLEPLPGAIAGVNRLRENFDVHILTRPSYMNPLCYTEKRVWIEKHFGLEFCKNLILAYDKSFLIGDYLVDDMPWPSFKGEQIQFGYPPFETWTKVVEYLESKL